jgi:two-component system, NtrC family, sensor kinase
MNSENDAESGTRNPQATILIVDDAPQNLAVLGAILQPLYRVRAASSGERALDAAVREPRPDLILLDIMMPQMDGFETLRRIRADELTRDIPVMFVTALQDETDEQRGFELGAADYLHKPVNPVIVRARVRAQLEAKAARDMLKNNNQRLVSQVAEGANALEQAQMQLLQAEKMAAMGQLAAGVAHEINNPIGFVGSNLSTLEHYVRDLVELITAYQRGFDQAGNSAAFAEVLMLRQKVDYDFLTQDLTNLVAESKEGIERVRRIVGDLKSFSRSGDSKWEWADIHQGIDSTLNIVWNELKYHCTVSKNYGSLPQIHCVPSQLNQVFMNLLVNAGQAIEGKGEITITTECAGTDAVRITIRDTGKGIAQEALQRIFEPFYTTKPVGKGTGLGLSLAWNIVKRHHGRIEVDSEAGKGTGFAITLLIDPVAANTMEADS